MNPDSFFCDFHQYETNKYRCSKCNMMIYTEDNNPPIFPCSLVISSKEPNLATKIKNFSSSLANHASNSFKLAEDAEIERRFKICETCDSFKNGSCLECGCPIIRTRNYISKLSWDSEKCPLNKW